MKKILTLFLFSLSVIGYAQDQLFKKDNSKVDVKILEINTTEIRYKLFTYQDGPTITISKKEVALIIYQNGVHEVVTSEPTPPAPVEQPYVIYNNYTPSPRVNRDSIEKAEVNKLLVTKNLVSFNMIEPINGSIGVNYIREFANNYFHVYVPVTVGFTSPYFTQAVSTIFSGNNYYYSNGNSAYSFTISDFKYTNKTYEVGLGIHFQTSGKRAVTHFVGPYIGTGQFTGTYTKTENFYDPNGYSSYASTTKKFTLNRTYVMLDNGLLFRVTKSFNIMMLAGIGYHIDSYKIDDNITKATNYNTNEFPINAFKFGLSFGYRF